MEVAPELTDYEAIARRLIVEIEHLRQSKARYSLTDEASYQASRAVAFATDPDNQIIVWIVGLLAVTIIRGLFKLWMKRRYEK